MNYAIPKGLPQVLDEVCQQHELRHTQRFIYPRCWMRYASTMNYAIVEGLLQALDEEAPSIYKLQLQTPSSRLGMSAPWTTHIQRLYAPGSE